MGTKCQQSDNSQLEVLPFKSLQGFAPPDVVYETILSSPTFTNTFLPGTTALLFPK